MGSRFAAVWGWIMAAWVLAGCERGGATILDGGGFEFAVGAIHGAQAAQTPAVELQAELVIANDAKGTSAKPPEGYQPMTPRSRSGPAFGNVVLLFDPAGEVVVPIFIGGTEALSIQLRLNERRYARPLTHDLLDSILEALDVQILRAQVDTLQDNVYIGTVVLRRGDEIIKLDARPSDAIALAIGNQVPIYVSQQLIDKAGVKISELDAQKPDAKTDPIAL